MPQRSELLRTFSDLGNLGGLPDDVIYKIRSLAGRDPVNPVVSLFRSYSATSMINDWCVDFGVFNVKIYSVFS